MQKIIPNDAVLIPDQAHCVFQGKIYDVYQWPQKMFDGSSATFEMLRRPDTVSVICVVDDNLIVLEDEQPHSGMKLSFPSGRVDSTDMTILDAAKREALEETGYTFQSWKLISVRQPHAKIEWFVHTFVAWEVSGQVAQVLDPGERIAITKLPFDQVRALTQKDEGYLGESKELFDRVGSIDGLQRLPSFVGKEIAL